MNKLLISLLCLSAFHLANAEPPAKCDFKNFNLQTYTRINTGQTEEEVSKIIGCSPEAMKSRTSSKRYDRSWRADGPKNKSRFITVTFVDGKVAKDSEGKTDKMGTGIEINYLLKIPQKACKADQFKPNMMDQIKVGSKVEDIAKQIGCSPEPTAEISEDGVSATWQSQSSKAALSLTVMLDKQGVVVEDDQGEPAMMATGF